jgi:hypothetical protein
MSSRSSINFHDNKKDIELLWHIHAELPGAGKKRRYKADVLNRSAIILISACWEAYVEDVSMRVLISYLINLKILVLFLPKSKLLFLES